MKRYINPLLTVITYVALQIVASVGIALYARLHTDAPVDLTDPSAADNLLAGVPVYVIAIALLLANAITVVICWLWLKNIRPYRTFDFESISSRGGLLGFMSGVMGCLSLTLALDYVEMSDALRQTTMQLATDPWGIALIAFAGPVFEELIFREALIGGMTRRGINTWVAIILSALFFGIAHGNVAQTLYAFPLGLLFGIIYAKTGNIGLSLLLHFLNNSLVVLQVNLMDEEMLNITYREWLGGSTNLLFLVAVTAIICITLTVIFWMRYMPKGVFGTSLLPHTNRGH